MNPNPRAILTGALLAAGTAAMQATLTALGCGPAGIVTSAVSLLTTAITILGPRLIELRAQHQLGADIRWIIEHAPAGADITAIATLLKDYQVKALDAHVAAIKASRAPREAAPGRAS